MDAMKLMDRLGTPLKPFLITAKIEALGVDERLMVYAKNMDDCRKAVDKYLYQKHGGSSWHYEIGGVSDDDPPISFAAQILDVVERMKVARMGENSPAVCVMLADAERAIWGLVSAINDTVDVARMQCAYYGATSAQRTALDKAMQGVESAANGALGPLRRSREPREY